MEKQPTVGARDATGGGKAAHSFLLAALLFSGCGGLPSTLVVQNLDDVQAEFSAWYLTDLKEETVTNAVLVDAGAVVEFPNVLDGIPGERLQLSYDMVFGNVYRRWNIDTEHQFDRTLQIQIDLDEETNLVTQWSWR